MRKSVGCVLSSCNVDSIVPVGARDFRQRLHGKERRCGLNKVTVIKERAVRCRER